MWNEAVSLLNGQSATSAKPQATAASASDAWSTLRKALGFTSKRGEGEVLAYDVLEGEEWDGSVERRGIWFAREE